MNESPSNSSWKRHTVICLGASIVRGMFGASFVTMLEQHLKGEEFCFINSGIGGNLAFDVLRRVESVIAEHPDFVILLVGTNDVTAELYPKLANISVSRLGGRPNQPASARSYHDSMLRIVHILKEKTTAKIALASLPVLGEDLTSLHNQQVMAYNDVLKNIAIEQQISYLPVHESQTEFLRSAQGSKGRTFEPKDMLTLKLIISHYLTGRSYDDISRRNGFLLVTDGMHMNSRGAGIIADVVETFLHSDKL